MQYHIWFFVKSSELYCIYDSTVQVAFPLEDSNIVLQRETGYQSLMV